MSIFTRKAGDPMYVFHELEGERVKLIPLELKHCEDLFYCSRNPRIWEYYPTNIKTIDEMRTFVQKAIDGRDKRDQFPFAVFDKESDAIVGTTRYLRISEDSNNLNIGSTWYSPKIWRTRVNTEAKYLLLEHAFEQLQICRVELITTTTNLRSQKAIERLGATHEGLLRKKYHGLDYMIYSIIDTEWYGVKHRLGMYLNDVQYPS